jgi:hypothetical protein
MNAKDRSARAADHPAQAERGPFIRRASQVSSVGRQASKDYGIPRGMAYLTGFVVHAGILAEDEAV